MKTLRIAAVIAVLLAALAAGGCGHRGDLKLPPADGASSDASGNVSSSATGNLFIAS